MEVILAGGTSNTPKIASNLSLLFPQHTTILASSTSATAINPSELSARGAAIQASLIQEFDIEDISQSAHPMVTVTPHLENAIGVLALSDDTERGIFKPVLEAETALPARRTVIFGTPKDGGNVMLKVCEGIRSIKVTKPEPKAKADGKTKEDDDEDDEDDEDFSDEEEEEIREKSWKAGKVLAEVAVKDVKKKGKVEVTINVNGELAVQVIAREVGSKTGVRGTLDRPRIVENGAA